MVGVAVQPVFENSCKLLLFACDIKLFSENDEKKKDFKMSTAEIFAKHVKYQVGALFSENNTNKSSNCQLLKFLPSILNIKLVLYFQRIIQTKFQNVSC